MVFNFRAWHSHCGVLVVTAGCLVLTLGTAIAWRPKAPKPAATEVQYAVYADYLSEMTRGARMKTPFVGVVVHQSATATGDGTLDPFHKRNLTDLRPDTWRDFVAQNNAPFKETNFHEIYLSGLELRDPAKVRLILQQQLPFKADNFSDQALRVNVSRIGLNKDSTQAFFYVDMAYGLCPFSQFVVMHRTAEDRWQVQNLSTFPLPCL